MASYTETWYSVRLEIKNDMSEDFFSVLNLGNEEFIPYFMYVCRSTLLSIDQICSRIL